MRGPRHDRAALAEFQQGETRLVYARYRDRPHDPPFYLEDGQAQPRREWAKEHLECLMPDCQDRRLTTVSRRGRRDGFTHYSGAGGHSAESLFHEQGKALLARWASEHLPDAHVVAEQATADRTRRADVMVSRPDGNQVALEVQYAGLTVHEWEQRHGDYTRQGIRDVWLFGHLPRTSSTGSRTGSSSS